MEINVGLTDRCNLKCKICEGRQLFAFNRPDMPFEGYLGLLEQAKQVRFLGQSVTHVRLDGNREPLLYPQLADAVRAAAEGHFIPSLTTNGVRLDEAMAQALLDAGLRQILISITGLSPEVYARFQGYGVDAAAQWQRVRDNIERLVRLRGERRAPLKITVSYILGLNSFAEARDAVFYWKDMGVDAIELRDYLETRSVTDATCHPASVCMRTPVILSTGEVTPCCRTNEQQVLGNIFETPLNDILNAPDSIAFMQALAAFDFARMPPGSRCPQCDLIRTFPGEKRFSI